MNSPDKVILHIYDRSNGFSSDIQIPIDFTGNMVRTGILNLLKQLKKKEYGDCESIDVKYKGQSLENHKSLGEEGIWDGSELELISVRRKRGDFFERLL